MKYRKKPVVIEAWQNVPGAVFPDWVNEVRGGAQAGLPFYVKTLEGNMRADGNDWLIRGVKGEAYPCKPDIFAATYEPAEYTTDHSGAVHD